VPLYGGSKAGRAAWCTTVVRLSICTWASSLKDAGAAGLSEASQGALEGQEGHWDCFGLGHSKF
jgi:hypothetical protein